MGNYEYFNEKASGLKGFVPNPVFIEGKKASLEELKAKSEASNVLVRQAGQGFKKRARNAQAAEEGNQVDFIVLDEIAYYVGDIKTNNTMLNVIPDMAMINISTGAVVSINTTRNVIEAQIDRLTVGDKDTYNKVNFNQSKKMIAEDGKKYQINNQKSLSLMSTLPEANFSKEAAELADNLYTSFQTFHDYLLTQTETSSIGQGPKFKPQTMFLSTKDVLRGLIISLVPDASEDEVKQIVGACFAENGVGPLSTMSIDLTFTVTKVMRSKDPSKYPEYNEIDEDRNALRTFVTAYNVSVPINPQILVDVSVKMENFKKHMVSTLIQIHNLTMDETALVVPKSCPAFDINKHILADITLQEFAKFQTEVLPKAAASGVDRFFKQADTRAKQRYVEIKEAELDDDFNA